MAGGDGLDSLDGALADLIAGLSGERLQAATDAAAAVLEAEVKSRAPNRTGNLQHHVAVRGSHSSSTAKSTVEVLDSAIGGAAQEAVFVEYGTSRMAAEPFMRPAFEAKKAAAADAFAATLKSQLDKT